MNSLTKSTITAVMIAAAIQFLTVGLLSNKLPREVCRPGVALTKSLNFNNINDLHINHTDGPIDILTHSKNTLLIEADIRIYFNNQETQVFAEKHLETLLLTNEKSNGKISIITEPDLRPDDMDIRVNYTITVPEGTDIDIDGSNGNVYIAAGCGDIDIFGNNSDIDIYTPSGNVNARSINGRIRAFETSGETQITTVNGSIYAHLMGGTLYADTTNGAIIGYLLDPEVKSCNLTSVNGGITLVVPETGSASVNARTDRGNIRSDFPMLEHLTAFETKRELQGDIGHGDIRLTMESMNGNIAITRSST